MENIIEGTDERFTLLVGPCSIHHTGEAVVYAEKLNAIRKKVESRIAVFMRVYLEKPRTTVGWKGLLTDPRLDGSEDINAGLVTSRELMCTIADIGLPIVTESLDTTLAHYMSDMVSVGTIGARTSESQPHRQMMSGLSMPVGVKNGTSGDVGVAIDAIISARSPHTFLGIDDDARSVINRTTGNPHGFLIMRGGTNGTNYDPQSILSAQQMLRSRGIYNPRVVVDCSHGNSQKNPAKQALVFREVLNQRHLMWDMNILGCMIESSLIKGKQDIDQKPLKYGVSVTDGCIGWEETEVLIMEAFEFLKS